MKILFGSIVVDARGRLNGHVFRKTAFGNSVTALALPRGRDTNYQNPQLNVMGQILRQWSELDEIDRTLWNQFAMANPIPNEFGVPRNIGGKAMFVRLTWGYDYPGVTAPPIDQLHNEVPANLLENFSVASASGFISFDVSVYVGEMVLAMYVQSTNTAVQSPPANKWRRIPNFQVVSAGTKTTSFDIRNITGINLASKKTWLRVKLFNEYGWGNAEIIVPLSVT